MGTRPCAFLSRVEGSHLSLPLCPALAIPRIPAPSNHLELVPVFVSNPTFSGINPSASCIESAQSSNPTRRAR